MAHPISIRLDGDVRAALEQDARDLDIPLATYLRAIAADRARESKQKRTRDGFRRIGMHVQESTEASDFMDDVGTPSADID